VWIVIQIPEGLELIERGTGKIHRVRSALLDPVSSKAVIIEPGRVSEPVTFDQLI
jgi:hypothetical protein